MARLDVYISDNCWSCNVTREIVAEIGPQFPSITIELRDIGDERRPSCVFATPTYVLDGRTIFLGNPTPEQLQHKLEDAQAADGQPGQLQGRS
ncbi:MAG: hypothetical protein PVH18_10145 [Chloroflexota bacterium]